MDRRTFTKSAATVGGLVLVGGLPLTQTACKKTDIGFYIDTIVGALSQLKPLLPGAAQLIAKAVTIANDLLAAYKRGAFADASAFFANLSDVLNQIAIDAGLNNKTALIILAVAGVALRTIASLLSKQAPAQLVAASKKTATSEQLRGATMIEQASTEAAIMRVVAAVKMQ